MIDRTALKFNQGGIIVLLSAAWLIGLPALVGFVAFVMLLGTVWPEAALFKLFYRTVVRPTGLLKAHPVPDRQAPHRFAQGFGGVVVAGGYAALLTGHATLGWTLALMVVALAFINVAMDVCVGCLMFYQLERLGLIRAPKEA